jgi:hypothetical protein
VSLLTRRMMSSIGAVKTIVPEVSRYETEVLADTPVAYWRLNELAGSTVEDTSGNGNTATYATVTMNQTGATGDGDLSVANAGSDNLLTSSWTPPAGSGARTIEWWMKNSTSSGFTIFDYGNNAFNGARFLVQVTTTSGGRIVLDGLGRGRHWTAPQVFDGEWHHYMMVYNGNGNFSGVVLYIDLVLAPVVAGATGSLNTSSTALATWASGGIGQWDDIAWYSTALDPHRRFNHFAAIFPHDEYAGGGIVTDSGGKRYRKFWANSDLEIFQTVNVDWLLTGGGGGSMAGVGGVVWDVPGGGAVLVEEEVYELTAGTYPVVVGQGGARGGASTAGGNGETSTFESVSAVGGFGAPANGAHGGHAGNGVNLGANRSGSTSGGGGGDTQNGGSGGVMNGGDGSQGWDGNWYGGGGGGFNGSSFGANGQGGGGNVLGNGGGARATDALGGSGVLLVRYDYP